MSTITFKDIHIQFCKRIDELQVYNNFTVNLSRKKIAIEDCILFINYIKNMKYQAIQKNHTYEADQLFHMQCFLNSLLSSLKIWILLEEYAYKKAWDSLIDAQELMCAELAGDFHLGDSRQLTDKSLLPFDLVS